jgi:hypothetical protein
LLPNIVNDTRHKRVHCLVSPLQLNKLGVLDGLRHRKQLVRNQLRLLLQFFWSTRHVRCILPLRNKLIDGALWRHSCSWSWCPTAGRGSATAASWHASGTCASVANAGHHIWRLTHRLHLLRLRHLFLHTRLFF